MEDAASKLLLVPTSGNQSAEQAAKELGVPVAVLAFKQSGGALGCTAADRDFPVVGNHAPRTDLNVNSDAALLLEGPHALLAAMPELDVTCDVALLA